MASLQYLNQAGPFWDFVNNLDRNNNNNNQEAPRQWAGPPGWGPAWHGRHRGPPPAAPSDGAHPPPPSSDMPFRGPPAHGAPPHSPPPGSPPDSRTPDSSDGEAEKGPGHERRGSHGPHDRHGPHGHGHGGHRSSNRRHGQGGCGRRGRGGAPPFGQGPWGFSQGPWNMNPVAELINNFIPKDGPTAGNADQGDFVPAVDVFDTETAYVVHVSLAGAKKEDTAVSWDPDMSELSITGVLHRPGDEDFLKTLALDERKVGAFERKVKLGSRASPARIEVDGITAKLEDGILQVHVPKEDKDFVEIKKVDIQ